MQRQRFPQYYAKHVRHAVHAVALCTCAVCAGCHNEHAADGPSSARVALAPSNLTVGGSGAVRAHAYDRIQDAAAQGCLARKDAVLLMARVLFAPETFPPDSDYAPAPGDAPAHELGGTAFYKEVHQVYDELTDDERRWLCSLNEDLRVIIEQKKREQPAP